MSDHARLDGASEAASSDQKAFLKYVLQKEIRLSFVDRIRGTIPAAFQSLIFDTKEGEVPRTAYLENGMFIDLPIAFGP